MDKIISLHECAKKAHSLKEQGHKIALCHGTFDLLHIGHIRHLQHAASLADYLFVTITTDEHVNKGPGRPVFNQQLRAEHVAALQVVENVSLNEHTSSVNVINLLKPDIYVKGSDYKVNELDLSGNIVLEKEAVEMHGGKIYYTDEITFSSSKLLNDHFDVFPPETKNFLNNFKRKYSSDRVIDEIKSIRSKKVLIVGDAIVDEYHYTVPLGQTGKYNVLSVKYEDKERFAGGSIAVANHSAGLVDNLMLFSGIGEIHSHEDFIRSKLKSNINTKFIYFPGSPTLVKRRYVDADMNKLFEVYFYNDQPIDPALEQSACDWLEQHLNQFDIVIVPDFGNGFLTSSMIEVLCERAKFLAVNTQLNSGNRGYHVIHRYHKADYVSLNEPEIRVAAHDRHSALEDVAEQVGAKANARYVAVTRGRKGVDLYDRLENKCHKVPALSTIVVDRIGAGDAYLSISGLLLGSGIDPGLAAFVGSTAAALDVQIVCNREPVDPLSLSKYVTTLLK